MHVLRKNARAIADSKKAAGGRYRVRPIRFTQGTTVMDIQRYHQDHADILRQIEALRELSRAGIADNAEAIGELIVTTASRIKFHLAAEDQVLYPALVQSGDTQVAALGARYRDEMHGLAEEFAGFVGKWRVPARVAADPEGFRAGANTVLRRLFERLKREDAELYPAAEQL